MDNLRRIFLKKTGPNWTELQLGDLGLYFSYQTLVAMVDIENGWLISENVWSRTTGKHMNQNLPDHVRIPHREWEEKVSKILAEKYGLRLDI